MNQLSFATARFGNFYKFHTMSPPATDNMVGPMVVAREDYMYYLDYYLSLTDYLSSSFKTYAVLPAGHYNIPGMKLLGHTRWQYFLINDEWADSDIDTGWFSTVSASDVNYSLFEVQEYRLLKKLDLILPVSDSLQCILFSLQNERASDLADFLSTQKYPYLSRFLQDDELFVNIVVAKKVSYFHSMAIKTKGNIIQNIDIYQHVIDSEH